MEKYERLFELSKEAFHEDIHSFARIEEKVSRFFTILTVLVGVVGFACKWSIENYFGFGSTLDILGFCNVLLMVLSLILAWYFSFRALKPSALRRMTLSDEWIAFFNENEMVDIHYAMAREYKEAFRENRKTIDEKAWFLRRGYQLIISTLILAVFAFVLIGLGEYQRKAQADNEVISTPVESAIINVNGGTSK